MTGPRRPAHHTHPRHVPLHQALAALSSPVRLAIIRTLAAAPDWHHTNGSLNLPVDKSSGSHHFAVLRSAGLLEQRDKGPYRVNRLRQDEFGQRFPGLLNLVLSGPCPSTDACRPAEL